MNKSIFTKILAVLLVAIACLTLCSCQKEEENPILDESGNLYPLDKNSISYDGQYYIKKGENYYRLNTVGINSLSEQTYYQWFTPYYDKYTPVLGEECSLVYINNSARPSSVSLIKLEDQGYTLGTLFETFSEGGRTEVRFKEDSYCSTSPIGTHLVNGVSNFDAVKLTKIGSKDFSRSMIDTLGFIHGMEQGANYKFCFYEGTVYKNITLKADTHLYITSTKYSTSKFKETQNIYYEAVLPENLPNGKYLIPDFGVFEYNIEDNVFLPVNIDNIIGVENNDSSASTENNNETNENTINENEEENTILPEMNNDNSNTEATVTEDLNTSENVETDTSDSSEGTILDKLF